MLSLMGSTRATFGLARTLRVPLYTPVSTFITASHVSYANTKAATRTKKSTKATTKTSTRSKNTAAKPKKATPAKKDKPWERRDEKTGELLPLPYDRKPTKRPRFLIYFMERLEQVREKPEFQMTNRDGKSVFDIRSAATTIGAEWKQLSDSERSRIDKLYEEHVKKYEKDLQAWQKSLTPDEIQRQNQFFAYQRKQGKKAVPRNISGPDQPKRPLSAFFLFTQHLREQGEANTMPVTEFAREAGAKWKALSAKEKEPYEEKARASKEEYLQRMEEFKTA